MDLELVVLAIVVFGAATGGGFVARRRRAGQRADATNGTEMDRAGRASNRTLPVAFILIAGQGLWQMTRGDLIGGVASYGVIVLVIAAYWINDFLLRRADQ